MTTDLWRKSERIRHFQANPISSFVHADEYFPQSMQAADMATRRMLSLGVGWQAGTIIALPTGESVVFTFERHLEDGPTAKRRCRGLASSASLAAQTGPIHLS